MTMRDRRFDARPRPVDSAPDDAIDRRLMASWLRKVAARRDGAVLLSPDTVERLAVLLERGAAEPHP